MDLRNAAPPNTAPATDSGRTAESAVMAMLADHVPLSLLVDLCAPGEPASGDIFTVEGRPAQSWWDPR